MLHHRVGTGLMLALASLAIGLGAMVADQRLGGGLRKPFGLPATKEGWRIPFRALVPRVGPISNDGGRRASCGQPQKRIAARRREEAEPEGSPAKSLDGRPFPHPQVGGSDAPHVWTAQFSRRGRRHRSHEKSPSRNIY
jgi:hypothetical protein